MSLNEIVNCPTKFASSSPYLVVQHVDWIQCRYLLVLSQNADSGVYNNVTAGNQSAPTWYVSVCFLSLLANIL